MSTNRITVSPPDDRKLGKPGYLRGMTIYYKYQTGLATGVMVNGRFIFGSFIWDRIGDGTLMLEKILEDGGMVAVPPETASQLHSKVVARILTKSGREICFCRS